MSKIDLSPKQQEIVSFRTGRNPCKASAGCGKTRVLTARIKKDSRIQQNGKYLLLHLLIRLARR